MATAIAEAETRQRLLRTVKKEVKQIMEEAVTRKFVHEDSSHIVSFCAAVEACVLHGLKRRAAGFLRSNKVAALFTKVAKSFAPAEELCRKAQEMEQVIESKRSQTLPHQDSTRRLPRLPSLSPQGFKHLWIRTALIEKVLDKIVLYLVENSSKFYEKEAIMMDPVDGHILASLLVGPCALEYTKMKTADHFWTDPSADELMQRHRIHSGHCRQDSPTKRPALCIQKRHSSSSIDERPSPSPSARDYVESLHQNNRATLLFGKNNVLVQPRDDMEAIPGYLSLHQTADVMTLKWTPNQLMNGSMGDLEYERSVYWDYAMTIPLEEIVYLHCHQQVDSGGTVVLVSQDGIQRPPLRFPRGGHLLQFLSCLENGLLPHGQLDPPLWSQRGKGKVFPKLRKRGAQGSYDSISDKEEDEATDYVFRILFPNSQSEFAPPPELMDQAASMWQPTPRKSSCSSCSQGSFSEGGPPNGCNHERAPLKLLCDNMKYQIISRAFYGWLAYCRHLSTVRTHLSALVNHAIVDPDAPCDAYAGLTSDVWQSFLQDCSSYEETELLRLVYYGGVEPSLRKEVWPFLLGHYQFGMSVDQRKEVDEQVRLCYEQTMSEWQGCEAIVKQREREQHAVALAKCSSGASIDSTSQKLLHRDSTLSNESSQSCSSDRQSNARIQSDSSSSTQVFESVEEVEQIETEPRADELIKQAPKVPNGALQNGTSSPDSGHPSSRNFSVASALSDSLSTEDSGMHEPSTRSTGAAQPTAVTTPQQGAPQMPAQSQTVAPPSSSVGTEAETQPSESEEQKQESQTVAKEKEVVKEEKEEADMTSDEGKEVEMEDSDVTSKEIEKEEGSEVKDSVMEMEALVTEERKIESVKEEADEPKAVEDKESITEQAVEPKAVEEGESIKKQAVEPRAVEDTESIKEQAVEPKAVEDTESIKEQAVEPKAVEDTESIKEQAVEPKAVEEGESIKKQAEEPKAVEERESVKEEVEEPNAVEEKESLKEDAEKPNIVEEKESLKEDAEEPKAVEELAKPAETEKERERGESMTVDTGAEVTLTESGEHKDAMEATGTVDLSSEQGDVTVESGIKDEAASETEDNAPAEEEETSETGTPAETKQDMTSEAANETEEDVSSVAEMPEIKEDKASDTEKEMIPEREETIEPETEPVESTSVDTEVTGIKEETLLITVPREDAESVEIPQAIALTTKTVVDDTENKMAAAQDSAVSKGDMATGCEDKSDRDAAASILKEATGTQEEATSGSPKSDREQEMTSEVVTGKSKGADTEESLGACEEKAMREDVEEAKDDGRSESTPPPLELPTPASLAKGAASRVLEVVRSRQPEVAPAAPDSDDSPTAIEMEDIPMARVPTKVPWQGKPSSEGTGHRAEGGGMAALELRMEEGRQRSPEGAGSALSEEPEMESFYPHFDSLAVAAEKAAATSPVSSIGATYSQELLDMYTLNLHRIDKDVQRCDRNYWYFTPANLEKLRNIMCSYIWQHLEIGYVQGMCDLLAPLLVILDDEALAFSCFTELMKRMNQNFPHGGAMDTHFANMRSLIQILDSELFELMHQNGDYTHFYFCYRWFLLDFKRELVYDDVFSVWETIWAAKYVSSSHFVLFIALALVEIYRDIILENNMDFTDIIKFFNEMAEHHNIKQILTLARDLVCQVQTLIENK
ncbi:small G protein signaling modulator 1 isoform X2 [Sardina pilchardus]|uniref:small G protein signaling modulator 1 isoform X2 n=1 Tax=Sardina pilchardus TaxID=27697 RepID=UPI002E118BC4